MKDNIPRPKRQPVLVVGHSDGYLEAFADRAVDVRFFLMPHTTTMSGERLGDEWLELTLPYRYRELYRADRLRCNGIIRSVRPTDLAVKEYDRHIFAGLDNVAAMLGGGRKVTCRRRQRGASR